MYSLVVCWSRNRTLWLLCVQQTNLGPFYWFKSWHLVLQFHFFLHQTCVVDSASDWVCQSVVQPVVVNFELILVKEERYILIRGGSHFLSTYLLKFILCMWVFWLTFKLLDLVRSEEDVIVFNDELSCLCYVMCVTPPLFACLFTSIIMN